MKYARRGGALGLGLVLLAVAWPASAQGWLTGAFAAPGSGATVAEPSQEVWAGADVSARSWSAYTGIMAALFGSLQADGWRVRAVGGYGAYAYSKHGIKVRGDVSYTDVLVGAHRQLGPLTVKAFVGVSTEAHVLTPLDLDNEALGAALGAKAVLETWLELSPRSWASIDLSGSTVHGGDYAARARAGYRIWPELSLGLEAAATGDGEYGSGRGGAFLRYTWASGEVSAAAGASIDRTGESSGYGALNALYRY
ncbi:MAG: cellulose biosynthesis protein BcsS [Hyphomicrobiaceae bacterium]|nr:cellulose biosynthesis protein BcsS [Hyphomicrobiaceae bacterium]